jgi:flagellar motor switch/type III secretory pathway protein FliN
MTVAPFPFAKLERVSKSEVRALASLREAFATRVEASDVARALAELTGAEVEIAVRSLSLGAPSRRYPEVALEGDASLVILGVSPDLALALLGRVLGRSFTLARHDGELGPNLEGALAALVVEAARRATSEAFDVVSDARLEPPSLRAELAVFVDGKTYGAYVLTRSTLGPTERAGERARDVLAALGELPIAVPVVVAASLSTRGELAAIGVGAAWLPGDGAFVDVHGVGRGLLAAPCGERGRWVDLAPGGRVVLRGDSAELGLEPAESSGAMKETSEGTNDTLTDIVVDAPVVVRVELGSVSLTASEWARLRPGDVIETGRRLSEPAILRVGGRAVARGELVDVEGELGVRVRELLSGSEE